MRDSDGAGGCEQRPFWGGGALVASLVGCGSDNVACIDADSSPPLCYQLPYCFDGDANNAADEEHADTTCAELGYTVDCGDGDFYDVWAMNGCPE